MIYYQLIRQEISLPDGERWHIDFPRCGLDAVPMTNGQRIKRWNDKTAGIYTSAEFCALDFQPCAWPLFSARLREFLEQVVPDAVQFLSVQLQKKNRTGKVHGYSIGHILCAVDCLDRVRTKVSNNDWTPRANGTFRVLHPICLSRRAIGDHFLFRVLGAPSHLVVAGDLKASIESHEFTGCRFVEMLVSE